MSNVLALMTRNKSASKRVSLALGFSQNQICTGKRVSKSG
jgi:hypothetical protein